MTDNSLAALAACYEIALDPRGEAALTEYLRLMLIANEQFNLTAIKDPAEAVEKHLLDCLIAAALPQVTGSVADVGTGGGFPAVVIKALKPECRVTAIDATEKKLNFVAESSSRCGIPCHTAHIRAEDAGRDPAYREKFDCVTARAVAALPMLCEYCLPLVRVGGHFVAMKAAGAEAEIAAAQGAIAKLGGVIAGIKQVSLPTAGERVLIIIKKAGHTPPCYPRKQKEIKAAAL